jgi:hypothetical protein
MVRELPDSWLNKGNNNTISPNAIRILKRLITVDSNRNCAINSFRPEPKVFLIPISFALSIERAVERLIKLIQASTNMKNGNDAENINGFDTAIGAQFSFEIRYR